MNAYLQALYSETETYVELPSGLTDLMPSDWKLRIAAERKEDKDGRVVFPVLKALYGLPKSGMDFISSFHSWLRNEGWEAFEFDHATFHKTFIDDKGESKLVIMTTYVDDVLVSVPRGIVADQMWTKLRSRWQSTDPEASDRFLGIVIRQRGGKIELNQSEYAKHIIQSYESKCGENIRPRKTLPAPLYDGPNPAKQCTVHSLGRSTIGGLMYLARGTRPDICRAVNCLASRVHTWSESCDQFLKGIIGYLKRHDISIVYDCTAGSSWSDWKLEYHSDANFVAPSAISGFCSYLYNPKDGSKLLLDWCSRKQTSASLSTCESEMVALVTAGRDAIAHGSMLEIFENGKPSEIPKTIGVHCDNLAACLAVRRGFSKQITYLSRTFGCAVGWLHERTMEKQLDVHFIPGKYNCADPFTKLIDDCGPLDKLLTRSTEVYNEKKTGDSATHGARDEGACNEKDASECVFGSDNNVVNECDTLTVARAKGGVSVDPVKTCERGEIMHASYVGCDRNEHGPYTNGSMNGTDYDKLIDITYYEFVNKNSEMDTNTNYEYKYQMDKRRASRHIPHQYQPHTTTPTMGSNGQPMRGGGGNLSRSVPVGCDVNALLRSYDYVVNIVSNDVLALPVYHGLQCATNNNKRVLSDEGISSSVVGITAHDQVEITLSEIGIYDEVNENGQCLDKDINVSSSLHCDSSCVIVPHNQMLFSDLKP